MSIKSGEIKFKYHYSAKIPLELPDLNSYNKASRSINGAILANRIKQETDRKISLFLTRPIFPLLTPVKATFCWTVKDKRKDPDNVAFATKFIFDAIVKKGILSDDNLNKIAEIHHYFVVDKDNVGVEISLDTMESAK